MFDIDTASEALARLMEAEGSQLWEPYGEKCARIVLPDNELLIVDQQCIAEAAAEIRIEGEL